MAHIHRLIFCALLALAAWLPASSFATIYPTTNSPAPVQWFSGNLQSYTNLVDACDSYAPSYLEKTYVWNAPMVAGNCSGRPPWGTPGQVGIYHTSIVSWKCPAPAALVVSGVAPTCVPTDQCVPNSSLLAGPPKTCQCNTNFLEKNGSCVASSAKCAAVADGSDLFTSSAYNPVGGAYCPTGGDASSCGASVTGGYATVKAGVKSWITEVTYDGTTCTPPTTGGTSLDAPTPCKGQAGTVNGVAVCIPFSPSNPPAETVTQTSSVAADGTVTQSVTNTKCNGENCTTSTSTTSTGSAAGSIPATTAKTETKPQTTFCADNPNSPMCKGGSFSSSGCSGPPSCDGDAIQCGIALQSWKTSCALTPDPSAESALYDTAKAVTGSVIGPIVPVSAVAISGANFSQAPHFASAGLSDLSITVSNKQINVPFSNLNQYLERLGQIGVAVALLVAMRIALGGAV